MDLYICYSCSSNLFRNWKSFCFHYGRKHRECSIVYGHYTMFFNTMVMAEHTQTSHGDEGVIGAKSDEEANEGIDRGTVARVSFKKIERV